MGFEYRKVPFKVTSHKYRVSGLKAGGHMELFTAVDPAIIFGYAPVNPAAVCYRDQAWESSWETGPQPLTSKQKKEAEEMWEKK